MRSAIIGLRWAGDRAQRVAFVSASTHLTHRDPQALSAALAVAETAAWIANGEPLPDLWAAWRHCGDDTMWISLIATLQRLTAAEASVDDLAQALNCPQRVSGYAMHSVPLALFAWLRHRHDPTTGFTALLRCGGDTDTMAAIAGALYGADDGEAGFPPQWISRICDWPLSLSRLRAAGSALTCPSEVDARPVPWAWPLQPLRNLVFLTVILGHGFRRLWPW